MILIHRPCADCEALGCCLCERLRLLPTEAEPHELTTAEIAHVLQGDFTDAERAGAFNELVARVRDEREVTGEAAEEAARRAA